VNPILKSPARRLLSAVGIHPDRPIPLFANQTFSKWYQGQNSKSSTTDRQAVFFYDTYLEYNYPQIGHAVTKIFKKAGVELIVPMNRVDSGRPSFSKGLLTKSQTLAKKNLKILIPYANQSIPILGCEPSDVVMLTKEYLDLVPGNDSQLVAKSAAMVEKYLLQEFEAGRITFQFDGHPRQVLFHGHCQHKANYGTDDILKLLRIIPNCSVTEINAGCCGMAGAFGYEKEHYQLSLEIAEMDLAPQIRSASPQTIISTSGTSCREQIQHSTGRNAVHPLEILASALI
jgi:Fe-S oxidoreductase